MYSAVAVNYYLHLRFDGDHEKVKSLNRLVTAKAGFSSSFIVTGQTYTRKVDTDVIARLSSFGATAHKVFSNILKLSELCFVC